MRLTVVGGGSTYTPELVDGLATLPVGIGELVLHDPDAQRLEVVGAFAARLLEQRGSPLTLRTTSDLEAAVDGASAVLIQLRVGGQQTRLVDETFPLECGCVGQETTGAGGLAKALRTVPVVLDVARTVRARAAADAWIIDFTNPVGIVTRALLADGHRAVGLCNVAIGFQRLFASWLDVAPAQVELDHVGLNHLTWIREARVAGVDALPGLIAQRSAELSERIGLPAPFIEQLGAVPSYYLRFFYAHDAVVRELQSTGARAEDVLRIERELLDLYADESLVSRPALLDERGGAYYSEAALQLLASLLGGGPSVNVANVRNGGTFDFLADDAAIEVPCDVSASGAVPRPVRRLEPLYAGLIAHVAAYEELALDAALRGGRARVVAALLAHPLIGQIDTAERLADVLIADNANFLGWAQ